MAALHAGQGVSGFCVFVCFWGRKSIKSSRCFWALRFLLKCWLWWCSEIRKVECIEFLWWIHFEYLTWETDFWNLGILFFFQHYQCCCSNQLEFHWFGNPKIPILKTQMSTFSTFRDASVSGFSPFFVSQRQRGLFRCNFQAAALPRLSGALVKDQRGLCVLLGTKNRNKGGTGRGVVMSSDEFWRWR